VKRGTTPAKGRQQAFRVMGGDDFVGYDSHPETGKPVLIEERRGLSKQAFAYNNLIGSFGEGDMDRGHARRLDFRIANIKEEAG
jgi:hypothetical protein